MDLAGVEYPIGMLEAIVQQNQSKAAEDADVSRQIITYQRAFRDMTDTERAALISALAQEILIEKSTEP